MGLPNLVINLQNGALGRVAKTSDGVAGLILTGKAEGSIELDTVYPLSSVRDLNTLEVTSVNNPLVYKEVSQFYAKAGEGAELYLLVVAEDTTLEQMFKGDAIQTLMASTKRRIRLLGVNRIAAADETLEDGISKDSALAGLAAQEAAKSFAEKINPFRVFIPAIAWDGSTASLFSPREQSFNRVSYVLASDETFEVETEIQGESGPETKIYQDHSAAVGQALGLTASIPVNYSLARVKNGMVAVEGRLTNGKTPEECEGVLDALHDAGYIIYRSFVGRNGYYFNDDATAAPLSDDYSSLNLGRVIDKAIILAYGAYVDEINDSIEVDSDGNIPEPMCIYYQSLMDNAVASAMQDEISSFTTYIDPSQNILSTSMMIVNCKIVPKGIIRDIEINLGFENPSVNN